LEYFTVLLDPQSEGKYYRVATLDFLRSDFNLISSTKEVPHFASWTMA